MHRYGLTDEEKKTHLQRYNHALFQNSLSFMDVIWEINLLFGTVVILEDKARPELSRTELGYQEFLTYCTDKLVSPEEAGLFRAHLSVEKLDVLHSEDVFYIHLRDADGATALYRVVLTPAIDEQGILFCVYLGALRIHEQPNTPRLPSREMFLDALLSNCYFSFHFDLMDGGLIWGDFEARDGTHPIRDVTGLSSPVPFQTWVQKWHELYKPQFDRQQAGNVFSIDYLLRCFAQKELFLEFDVSQKSPSTGKRDYLRMTVLLLEDPKDRHVHAYIIWRKIDAFQDREQGPKSGSNGLQRFVSRDDQFRRAALSGALMVYNINLTKNLIEEEFYEIVDGVHYPMLQLVGLTAPCSFDVFCQRWNESKVPEESKETFLKLYNRQYLLDAYAKGHYQLEIEFDSTIGRGIPVTLRNTILLIKDPESGEILAMVNAKDVTSQRKAENDKRRALQAAYDSVRRANSAKSDFLARMSHDIRTPMNAIIGMSAIASTHLDDPSRVKECLDKIDTAGKHLLNLINDVLDMSKIESGKLNLQEEDFVLSDLVQSLVDLCRPQIEAKHHTLNISIHDLQHEHVIGDSQHIKQAFINLMDNAVKYTPEGGRISLCITEKATNRPRVGCFEFVFQDNGIGMSESFLSKLFDPFERAQDKRAAKEQGTGLGMAITQNLVQMMNGRIDVESTLNQGTKFTVTIFLRLQENPSSPQYEQFKDLPVLLVDSDSAACENSCEMFRQLGMRAKWVQTGRAAIDLLNAEQGYFALILNRDLPDMDTLSVVREIRGLTGDQPFIVLQSDSDMSELEQPAREAGVNGFMDKPLFKTRMVCLLNDLLGQSSQDGVQKTPIEELAASDFSGKRALMAEDNELNAEIAEEIFGMIGLTVDRVVNGKDAVDAMERAADGYYDIVFMDIQMPVMNGFEAARAIRRLGRDYTDTVPILAISANAFAEDVEESKSSGMNDHIAKPLDFARLKSALDKWLK